MDPCQDEITINIFDFDGTIFKSPMPNHQMWDGTLIGKIIAMKSDDGLGWFQDPLTLAYPYVPELPSDDWFVPSVKTEILTSIGSTNTKTILLTGRSTLYEERIKQIVNAVGLQFDDYGFQSPNKDTTTMEFKCNFLKNMIIKYNPSNVCIYDDRAKHFTKFKTFMNENYSHLKCNVILIEPAGETCLSRDLELDLVNKLNDKITNKLLWKENVQYTAVLLDEESVIKLQSVIPPILGWTQYYHHMTIYPGKLSACEEITEESHQDSPNENKTILPSRSNIGLGKQATLTVTSVGKNDKAYAVGVSGFISSNKIPHITCCIAPKAKPVDSNFIKDWLPVALAGKGPDNQLILTGIVTEVTKMIPLNNNSARKGKTVVTTNITHKMTPLGKLFKDFAPNGTKKQNETVPNAIKNIKEWMVANNILDTKENESSVIEYIQKTYSI